MAKSKTKKYSKKPLSGSSRPLGDQQAMAYVVVGGKSTAAMADTGSQRSVIDSDFIRKGAHVVPLNKNGVMNIAGRKLYGKLVEVQIELIETSKCKATVEAFVPDEGQTFRKGVILGMDFLQGAKLRIDGETGEVYCPRPEHKDRDKK